MTKTIDSEVLDVLRNIEYFGNTVRITQQLDRKLYVKVNEVLERLGGTWDRKAKNHFFPNGDPKKLIGDVLDEPEMPAKNPFAFYETPENIIDLMISFVKGVPRVILEPSAGDGAIVRKLKKRYPNARITAIDIDPAHMGNLGNTGVNIVSDDFLKYTPFFIPELIIMNPPFAVERDAQEYISHIQHAYNIVAPGGQVIAIAPAGISFRNDKRPKELRELIESVGEIHELEDGAFGDSGTEVSTNLVIMYKPDNKPTKETGSVKKIDWNFVQTAHPGGYQDIFNFIQEKGNKDQKLDLAQILENEETSGIAVNKIQAILVKMSYSKCLPSSREWKKPCSQWKKDDKDIDA